MPRRFSASTSSYLTFRLGAQWFAVSSGDVIEIATFTALTPIPYAPDYIAGMLELRGRVATGICLHHLLGIEMASPAMLLFFTDQEEQYAVLVDAVGNIIDQADENWQPVPLTLDARWRDLCTGIIPQTASLLLRLDLRHLIETLHESGA